MTANILKNECHGAQVDPDLEPLTGNVFVSSVNSSDEIPCVRQKKKLCNQCVIKVEQSSFPHYPSPPYGENG
jgi:hypothetical protein